MGEAVKALEDPKGKTSTMRILVLGCFVVGSFIAIAGVFTKQSEAVWAGTGLAAVGIAGKYGQKRVEGHEG